MCVLHSTSCSAEITLFRMMCLAFGSTISPGIMEERLRLCGFIHIMRAFCFSFSLPFLSCMEDQQEQVIPQSFVLFLPQLWPERELWGVCVSVMNP